MSLFTALLPALCVEVLGSPIPQGSKKSFAHRDTGKIVTVEERAKTLHPWRDSVRWAAREAMNLPADKDFWPMTGPVRVEATFSFRRPKSHYRTGRYAHLLRENAPLFPITRAQGDGDKITRAVLDALDAAGVFVDDSQVADGRWRKVWCGEDRDSIDVPGVRIAVYGLGRSE